MIHKYFLNGFYIVLDVHSGAVHSVDKTVYDVLDYYKNYSIDEIINILGRQYTPEDISSACNEIAELEENGLMFSEDIYTWLPDFENKQPVVKAVCMHVAHDCNLRCGYCFADEGSYHSGKSLMTFEVGKQAIDFLIKNSGSRRNLEVDFFGGEPTLNFDVVKRIVAYARQKEVLADKHFRFTITTNGLLLDDEMISYISENMDNVVLSLDGRRDINDKMRKRPGGQGSYDSIVPKFRKLAEVRGGKDYYVRGTFTRHNLDFSRDVMHLAELGFKRISIEPVVEFDSDKDYLINESDLPEIFAEYERLTTEILSLRENGVDDFVFFHFMIDLTGGPCVRKRLAGCGAGGEYLAVTPDGSLYPCHQFTGIEQFKMGDTVNGVLNTELRDNFVGCNLHNKPDCVSCWAKYYCSGGCAANAFMANGEILKPYKLGCEMQRKRYECAIMLAVADELAVHEKL